MVVACQRQCSLNGGIPNHYAVLLIYFFLQHLLRLNKVYGADKKLILKLIISTKIKKLILIPFFMHVSIF